MAEGKGYEFDFRIFHPNGEQRWITSRATSLKDAAGRSVKMVGVSLDSTERKRVEDELRQSEERFRAIFELAGGALAYIGLDGHWQRVNQPLCELLGYSADELAGLTFQALTHPDDLAENLARVERLLNGEVAVSTMEKRFRRKDGSYIWVKVRASVQRNAQDGSPEHIISVYDDITAIRAERQALEARVAELERQLRARQG
ncbi:putative diguanylate cyclase YegE [compost metagenome]